MPLTHISPFRSTRESRLCSSRNTRTNCAIILYSSSKGDHIPYQLAFFTRKVGYPLDDPQNSETRQPEVILKHFLAWLTTDLFTVLMPCWSDPKGGDSIFESTYTYARLEQWKKTAKLRSGLAFTNTTKCRWQLLWKAFNEYLPSEKKVVDWNAD